jgi:iron complex transport system substrate-binding protein
VIEIPVRRIALLSGSVLTHIVDLGMIDSIVAVGTAEAVYDERVVDRVRSGRIVEIGAAPAIDRERLLAVQPDLVIYSPLGLDDAVLQSVRAAGIPLFVLADWREPTPLARLEWITAIGALLQRSEDAETILSDRVDRYEVLARQARTIPAPDRPSVIVNAPWRGRWPVPGGDSYIATYLEDAAGDYLWSDIPGPGTTFLDLESVLARGRDADVWINLNAGWNSRRTILDADPRLRLLGPMANGEVYHYSRRERAPGANDFWESGAAHPEIVLADLLSILHPSLLPDHEPVYYRRIE